MAPPRNKKNSGQAMVESAAAVFLAIVLVAGLLLVLYLSFTKIWVKSALYDGLICVQENRAERECRRAVESRLSFLPWGAMRDLSLDKSGRGHAEILIRDNLRLNVAQDLPETVK
ncbi:MAG: hypothetical protein ABL958_17310 [Bdellovibrionia bacterium]